MNDNVIKIQFEKEIVMIHLNSIAREITNYRRIKNLPSVDDLSKTSLGILEEGGEFEKARREKDPNAMTNALIDVMVFTLGALDILNVDIETELRNVIEDNKSRIYKTTH